MFWPEQEGNKGSQGLGKDSTSMDMEEVEHLLLPQKFCGRKGDKPLLEFDPTAEIEEGLFIVVLALDPESEIDNQRGPIWVAKFVEVAQNE